MLFSIVALVLTAASVVLVVVRAVKEEGYWRLLFTLILLSLALEILALIVSSDSPNTTTYLTNIGVLLYILGIIALSYKRKAGIFLYAVSFMLGLYDNTFHFQLFSGMQYFIEGMAFTVDGAIVVLAWILLSTDLAFLGRQRRLSGTF